MRNNTLEDVLGIGTCKLVMQRGRTLYLHDVLYAPEVRRNLVSIIVLLQLDLKLYLKKIV